MKKIKKLNQSVNFNNKKQRLNLYARTFRKHNTESQLFTLQREAINVSLHTAAFALNPSDKAYNKFCEAIGDIETMIESIKQTLPLLHENANNFKYAKLENLKNRTDSEEEAKKLTPESASPEEVQEALKKSTSEFKQELEQPQNKKSFTNWFKNLFR